MEIKIKEVDMIDSGCMNKGFPVFHKKGIVSTGGECSPFVFKGRLYRVESEDELKCTDAIKTREHSHARILDVETGEVLSRFAYGHYFFDAYVEDDKVYVFGTLNNSHDGWMGGDTVDVYESTDLVNWTEQVYAPEVDGKVFGNHYVAIRPTDTESHMSVISEDEFFFLTNHNATDVKKFKTKIVKK